MYRVYIHFGNCGEGTEQNPARPVSSSHFEQNHSARSFSFERTKNDDITFLLISKKLASNKSNSTATSHTHSYTLP